MRCLLKLQMASVTTQTLQLLELMPLCVCCIIYDVRKMRTTSMFGNKYQSLHVLGKESVATVFTVLSVSSSAIETCIHPTCEIYLSLTFTLNSFHPC